MPVLEYSYTIPTKENTVISIPFSAFTPAYQLKWSSSPGTATAGADYTINPSLSGAYGSIPANTTLDVVIRDDNATEGPEDFFFSWTVTLGDAVVTSNYRFVIDDGGSSAVSGDFKVSQLSLQSSTVQAGGPVSLNYTLINSGKNAAPGASAGLYFSSDPTINTSDLLIAEIAIDPLASGQSQGGGVAFDLPRDFPIGTYYVGLIADHANAVAEEEESNNLSTVLTLKVEPATPIITLRTKTIDEGGSSVVRVYFELSNVTDKDVTVQYRTQDITAKAGSDYVAAEGTLVIPKNNGSNYIEIRLVDDAKFEGPESFDIVLSNLVNARYANTLGDGPLGGTSTQPFTVTIVDNETPRDQASGMFNEMYDSAPSAAETDVLTSFATTQFNHGAKIGVASPLVYMHEAMGLALAQSTKPGLANFVSKYGPKPSYSDISFSGQAYNEVFGRAASAAQIDHFVGQVSYFRNLYTNSGAYGADADHITLLARGAAFGQIVGAKISIEVSGASAASVSDLALL